MARFVFCWELGLGLGHLVRYRSLVERLVAEGNEVFYLARDRAPVEQVFKGLPVDIRVVDPEVAPIEQRITEPRLRCFPTLLHNCGFYSSEVLARRARRWLDEFRDISPDVLIVDHSPTALVANRLSQHPAILAGNGFTAPPLVDPMPGFQFWLKREVPEIETLNRTVATVINRALESLGAGTSGYLGRLADLFECDQTWLMTFPELDCYGERPGGEYYGTFPSPNFGRRAEWPNGTGPRILAYLHPSKAIEPLATALRKMRASTCLYGPDLSAADRAHFTSKSTFISPEPFNLIEMRAEADLAITNGNANSTANFALGGVPQLALPVKLEQYMEARRIEIAGLGLMVPANNPVRLVQQLSVVATDPSLKRAAERFQAKYADQDAHNQADRLFESIKRLVSTPKSGA